MPQTIEPPSPGPPWRESRVVRSLGEILVAADSIRESLSDPTPPFNYPAAMRFGWRGHASIGWDLRSTLHRALSPDGPMNDDAADRRLERDMFGRFNAEGRRVASPSEAKLILFGDPLVPMSVARHAGLPVRAVDWSHSAAVAAYFACVERRTIEDEDGVAHEGEDGALLWFDVGAFDAGVHERWDHWGVPTRRDTFPAEIQRALMSLPDPMLDSLGFLSRVIRPFDRPTNGANWICRAIYPAAPRRMERQRGFLTIAGRIRRDHGEAIRGIVGDACGTLRIPADRKEPILEELSALGIDADSLGFSLLDRVAVRQSCRHRGAWTTADNPMCPVGSPP